MHAHRPLKFHWRLIHGAESGGITRATGAALGGCADLRRQAEFCRQAERAGMYGLLIDVGATKPDPIVLATALGTVTESIQFIIACRSGLQTPTVLVQQLNTLSTLIGGRFSLNVVAGHSPRELRFYGDFLDHDARYQRTNEFLAICRALWLEHGPVNFRGHYLSVEDAQLNTPFVNSERTFPEIFIAGGSHNARALALSQGTLWMRMADTPAAIASDCKTVLAAGKELGLRLSVIVRPTRSQAIAAARDLVAGLDTTTDELGAERRFVGASDSVSMKAVYQLANREWLTPCLWTGAVRSHGAPAIALVGTPEQVAMAILEYRDIGVSQFILSGWPKVEEMIRFGETVLPVIRDRETRGYGGVPAKA